jgi:peptidoglycan/xylan/chitin deacetylase (PgdA/CDA1 family)
MIRRAPAKVMRRVFIGYPMALPFLIYAAWGNWWWIWFWCTVEWFLVIYASLRANCQWLGPVITRFATNQNDVWLTIDDGPHPEDTPRLLELLREYQARATFFVVGCRAQQHPELIASIINQGHRIGNHSQTHPAGSFWCLSRSRVRREINGCAQVLQQLTGETCALFRAPVGMANWHVHSQVRRNGLRLIGWSARGLDGVSSDPHATAGRILSQVKPGCILLLHEGQRGHQNQPINVLNLQIILSRLREQGYAFVVPPETQWRIG